MISFLSLAAVAGLVATSIEGSPLGQASAAGTTTTFKPHYPYSATACTVTPVASPLFGLHCNTPGSLSSPSVLMAAMTTSNYRACANTCQTQDGCISFGFDTSSKSCTLYKLPLTHMGLTVNKASTVAFANRECFACSSSSTGVRPLCVLHYTRC